MFWIKHNTSLIFSRTIHNPYLLKKNYSVFEINYSTTKITTKTWLAKVAAIFIHITSLLHRISHPVSFYSKTKIGYIFSFQSSFGVLIFTFDMRLWMTYLFCVIKNNGNNVRCTTEGEKSNKCCARNYTNLFVRLRGTAQ